jgi:catechol 2,3-dioxygenase-like lactoylglutathione lyase family enzyme
VITGVAHTGVCVPDCEAAVAFYRDVLGFSVLSPPYVMDGDAIRRDMGELMPDPAMKAAIVGFGDRRVPQLFHSLRAQHERRQLDPVHPRGPDHLRPAHP